MRDITAKVLPLHSVYQKPNVVSLVFAPVPTNIAKFSMLLTLKLVFTACIAGLNFTLKKAQIGRKKYYENKFSSQDRVWVTEHDGIIF